MPFFMRHADLGLPNRAMPMHATDDRHVMSLVCFTLQSSVDAVSLSVSVREVY